MIRAALIAVSILAGSIANAAELTPEQDTRYDAMVNELRCLVCQNQTIADSNAPLAADLRDQVRAQILAGRSDAEIKTYVTERYGDFVLYRPPFNARTWLLWIAPFALVALAIAVALLFVRRSKGHAAAVKVAAPPDPAALQKLLDEDR